MGSNPIQDIVFGSCGFYYIDLIFFFLILYIFSGLINSLGERRILVFFIYFELIQLLLILVLLLGFVYSYQYLPIYIVMVLFIIGVSGSETAVFLVLFINYFRLTGLTIFTSNYYSIVFSFKNTRLFIL